MIHEEDLLTAEIRADEARELSVDELEAQCNKMFSWIDEHLEEDDEC